MEEREGGREEGWTAVGDGDGADISGTHYSQLCTGSVPSSRGLGSEKKKKTENDGWVVLLKLTIETNHFTYRRVV